MNSSEPDRGGSRPSSVAPLTRWYAGLEGLLLPLGQVDIWVTFVAEAFAAGLACQLERVLLEAERQQQAKFRFEKDRRRYLVTRALVRYALSRYAPVRPADWRFAVTEFGRPFIVDPHPAVANLVFNLSHSDRVVVLGVVRECQLGIDVEDTQRSVPLDIAESCFSADEVRQMRALPAALQAQRFLDVWTLKESYIKARGKGLSLPLETFGFDLNGERLRAYFDPGLNDSPHHWTFWQWRPSADSIAALCVENQAGFAKRMSVRRALPFFSEEGMAFDALRVSSP